MINIKKKEKRLPVNRSYPDITAFGKKTLIVGDSNSKKIKTNKLNNSFNKAKCIMKLVSGAKIQDLKHHVTSHVEHGKPDIAVIHIGSNNVSYNNLDIDASMLAENIIKIGKKCIDYGVEEVVISSIF